MLRLLARQAKESVIAALKVLESQPAHCQVLTRQSKVASGELIALTRSLGGMENVVCLQHGT